MNSYDSNKTTRSHRRSRSGGSRTDAHDALASATRQMSRERGARVATQEDAPRSSARDRAVRREARSSRTSRRSVGADSLTLSSSRALGLAGRESMRAYGRGETARRIEEDQQAEDVVARPAVYTEERKERARLSLSMPHVSVRLVVVLVALAIMGVTVFGAARKYYSAWRDAGILEVRYQVVSEQNASLTDELESLQTLEGIEDEARRRGYVYPDEQAVVAEGVEEEQVADPTLVDKAVEEYEASQPWYVHVLDGLFGYTYSAE